MRLIRIKSIVTIMFLVLTVIVGCSDSKDEPQLSGNEKFEIPADSRDITFEKSAATLEIKVNTDLELKDWKIEKGNATWLNADRQRLSQTESAITIRVSENTGNEKRNAMLTIVSTSTSKTLATINVTQAAEEVLVVDSDVKVTPTGAKASECERGQDIDKSIDGNYDTHYHSPWNVSAHFPVSLEYFFSGTEVIDYLVYYTRNGNGNFGKISLYVATDAARTYNKIGDYDFGMKGAPSMLNIPGSVKPTSVKIEVHSGLGDFVSCAEMEFYRSNTERALEKKLLGVFTDITCTELKSGVTDAQIDGLDECFRNVARSLRANTYDAYEKEFRIRSYEPYSNNDEWAVRLMTKKYSSLDNPTGICVNAGDELIVCVGDTHGQNISLQSIWEEDAGGYQQTQASGESYFLRSGVNKLRMNKQGQLFVMYNTDLTSPDAKPIKIHILPGSGKVTGFFDLKEHKTDAKYAELLRKATHKYFCVRGERIMFYFHRDKLTQTILSAINLWDDIIGWQQELMGIDDVRPSKFNNHLFAISPEGSYMWASDYRIAFVYTYLDNILLRENVMAAEDNAWGPAHEIGHVHQGAINWASSTESSNNLFSNYIIYKLGKYKSRGRGLEAVATGRYVNGEAWYNLGDPTHMNEDTETHLRMNWQLWNYYHRCGIKPDFWPTLFKLMREKGIGEGENPGLKQIEFAKMASKAAGENLTDFFEMWGFFIPVNTTIEQYGTFSYKVTADMIAEAKKYMAQFPKPKHAMQYIEDRLSSDFPSSDYRHNQVGDLGYYKTYTTNAKVATNVSAEVSGRTVKITNGSNAVAIEIRKGSETGEIKYFSNFLNFSIPSEITLEGCSLYAVQADGKRIHLKNL